MLCDIPPSAPFRTFDGCAQVQPGRVYRLPKGVTEVDVWTSGRLKQTSSDVGKRCHIWRFERGSYRFGSSAYWDTCRRTVHVYGHRTVTVFWWRG